MKHTLWILLVLCFLLSACVAESQPAAEQTAPETAVVTIPEETVFVTEEETTEETIPPVEGVDGETLYNEDQFALVFQDLTVAQLPENATRKEKAAFKEGWDMTMAAVNRTDITVYMRLMNLSVNSYMFENLPTVVLEPGEYREIHYTLTNEELEFNAIMEIQDLQFNLWVYDSEDFKTPDVADGLCKYYVNRKEPTYPQRKPQETDQILVENERYNVTVTQVTVGDDVTVQLHLQNYSDKELIFVAPYALVNEKVTDPLWACNVSGGKQRNAVLTFTAQQLKDAEIEDIQSIVLPIQIGDHNDWSLGAYFYEKFEIKLPVEPTEPEITE